MKHRLSRRSVMVGASAAVAAAGVASVPVTARGETTGRGRRGPLPTIVLVHGAWADASSWSGVIGTLQRQGYTVRAIPNMLRGPRTDAAGVRAFLAATDGPVVLVAHSYGGNVITDAAAGLPVVKALVYIAGFVPAEGESLGELASRPVSKPLPELPTVTVPTVLPDGTASSDIYLDPARFREIFAADVSAERTAVLAAVQRPAAAEALTGTTQKAAWRDIPSWYLVTQDDQSLSPETQRFMAKRAGASIVEIKSSHAAPVAHPGAVARLITQAARATG
ncbi:alpha/beta fold hydrolase [Streptomyces sp. NPDC017202]|uniref:alpha/beta fold hydrolase n=1 Tax=Streptomyces sp. NPDC017202 TaxID=3364981 RepID=UPI0037B5CFA6